MTTLTRAEMIEKYGSVPMGIPVPAKPHMVKEYRWTINMAHASVTWVTTDGGDTWRQKGVVWAYERNRRELEALEMQRIQREEK